MTMYCTLDEVKTNLGDMATEDYNDRIVADIEAVSVEIDNYCNRQFGSTTEARYFDGCGGGDDDPFMVGDLISVSALELDLDGDGTFETEMASTDYMLFPYNGSPKWRVMLSEQSSYSSFARGVRKGVKVTGTWGYSSVPAPIKKASIEESCRAFRRSQAGFGTVIGTPEIGTETIYQGLSSDTRRKLDAYVRRSFG